jgi:hypothetical protein
MMERVYICSRYRAGDGRTVDENVRVGRALCAYAISEGYAVYAAHLLPIDLFDDRDPRLRALGMQMDLAFLEVCSAIWVYGLHGISKGMQIEIDEAIRLGLPVVTLEWNCGGCEETRNAECEKRTGKWGSYG